MGTSTKLMGSLLLGLLALPGLLFASPILDEPIIGGQMRVAETGEVTALFLGSHAGYFNSLDVAAPENTLGTIFDKNTDAGSTISLGTFAADTELVFRLHVRNTGLDFFTGDAARNPDGLPHTLAVTSFDELAGLYVTDIGFEDLYGGGDEDYNDFAFRLTNVIDPPGVPEPSILALMGLGLAGIGYKRGRRKKTA